MRVLAIGAHPDDLEFMCAGTLLKCRDRGDEIFVALTTSGNTGSNVIPTKEENAAVREGEQLECCKHYHAQTMFLRFDDEGLLDTPETRKAVLNAIRWADPDLIICNPPWDNSPDHGMTGKLVTEVLLSVNGELHDSDYPPITGHPSVFFFNKDCYMDCVPDIYVDITEQMPEKRELCLMHKSQYSWIADVSGSADFFAELCEMESRYGGMKDGRCEFAEGFMAHQELGFMPNYKLLP